MSKTNDTDAAKTFCEVLKCELDEIEKSRQRREPSTAVVHAKEQDSEPQDAYARASKSYLVGLAFSGGGIRSATLNLGILQGLAQYNFLPRIDYLSTVSGGGYIGSWFTRWVWREGLDKVSEQLSKDYAAPGVKEPEAITFLRQYSNYLTPHTGIFSADTWTLIATYVRNVLLNLLTLMLVFVAGFAALKIVPYFYQWVRTHIVGGWIVASGLCVIFGLLVILMIFAHIARSAPNLRVEQPNESVTSDGWLNTLLRRFGDRLLQLQLVAPIFLVAIGLTLVIIKDPSIMLRWWLWLSGGTLWLAIMVYGMFFGGWEERWGPYSLWSGIGIGAGLLVGMSGFYWLQDPIRSGSVWWSPWDYLLTREQSQVLWGLPSIMMLALLGGTLYIGLMGRQLDSAQREWWAWLGGLLSIYTLTWIGLFTIAFFSTAFIKYLQESDGTSGWVNGILASSWITTTVGGLLAGKSPSTNGKHPNRWLKLLSVMAPPVFMLGFLILVSAVTDWMSQAIWQIGWVRDWWTFPWQVVEFSRWFGFGFHWDLTPLWNLVADNLGDISLDVLASLISCFVVSLGAGLLLAYQVDINEFSMHNLYRNRLSRCYQGASNTWRTPDLATGFDNLEDAYSMAQFTVDNVACFKITENHLKKSPLKDLPKDILESFKITELSLENLKTEVDCHTLQKLSAIVEKEYIGKHKFISILKDTIGKEETLKYKSSILKHTNILSRLQDAQNFCIKGEEKFLTILEKQLKLERKVLYESFILQHANSFRCNGDCDAKSGPYHLVNATLNLVGGQHLGWQKRKGVSFIFSPLYSGYDNDFPGQEQEKKQLKRGREAVGLKPVLTSESKGRPGAAYRPTGKLKPRVSDSESLSFAGGITMGTAVAVSGAAASPNMGYHSSKPLAFLMTLFNIRIGWWLANPAKDKWHGKTTTVSLPYLFTELFGLTTDRSNYLYLSDGGHFENLGIYELVRRRCRYIIACDAEADGNYTFGGLGNAIEKCRTDFGVEIEIDVGAICLARNEEPGARYCAVGTINYGPTERPGFLLYLKSALIGQEPTDLRRYKSENPTFPHETTGDQFFDETQFESYRKLGQHIVQNVFEAVVDLSELNKMPTEQIFVRLHRHWHPPLQAVEGRFTSLVHEYNRLMEALQQEPKLAFLDGQLNIGFAALAQEQCGGEAPDFWLPEKSGPLRVGFYFCTQLIVLMETVYHDLQLEINYEHPDARGWMNVFRHWGWSAMVQATWSITANTYGTRFQDFCKRRLNLKIGEVRVPKNINTFFPTFNIKHSVSNAFVSNALRDVDDRLKLNMVERRIVSQLARGIDTVAFWVRVYPVQLVIHSPSQQEDAKVTVGFGLVLEESKQIVYLRIQSHLRHMGLGRRAIHAFIQNGICSVSNLAVTSSISSRNCQDPSEANVTTEDMRRFQWLFESVKRTIPKADHDTSSETGVVRTEAVENALTS